ncbi:hypothetical protein [Herbaspirillum sp. NPDC101396]|uniref:hypothetical protein n=1 Tax=Herbaspirillum sp. NPDC101396 TaxID=3364005 RepID=UPI00383A7C03
MATENEVQLGNDVYVFASGTMASAFSSCLLKKTLASCREEFPPVSVKILSSDQLPDLDDDEADEENESAPRMRP